MKKAIVLSLFLLTACKPSPSQSDSKGWFWETFTGAGNSPDDPEKFPDWIEGQGKSLSIIYTDFSKDSTKKGDFNYRISNLIRSVDHNVEKLIVAGNIPSEVGKKAQRQFANIRVISEKHADEFVSKKLTKSGLIEESKSLRHIMKLQGVRIAESAKAKKRFFE